MTKLIDDPIVLTKKLIGFRSITPDDGGSLEFISSFVKQLGFQTKVSSTQGVTNLFARWSPKSGFKRTLAFNGHVDVVPPGEENLWDSDPFSGNIINSRIFGRGSVDMKSSVAAFLIALKEIEEGLIDKETLDRTLEEDVLLDQFSSTKPSEPDVLG